VQYGPPGAGKTTLIRHLAAMPGLDVYNLHLSQAGLDDTSLEGLLNRLPEKSLLVMEDTHVAFTSPTANREAVYTNDHTTGVSSLGVEQSSASR
jgi:chaperone BCS1